MANIETIVNLKEVVFSAKKSFSIPSPATNKTEKTTFPNPQTTQTFNPQM